MLHDIGKLVMLHIEDAENLAQLKKAIEAGMTELQAEYEVFGYTHIDAGMMLALHWHLPDAVHRVISFHHHPAHAVLDRVPEDIRFSVFILHLAHLAADSLMSEEKEAPLSGAWSSSRRISSSACEQLSEQCLPVDNHSFVTLLEHELVRLDKGFSAQPQE